VTVRDREAVNRNEHLTFRANAGVGRHGWLRLTPAYGVRLVRDRLRGLPRGCVVTDPFSGTGTTALAAAELGHLGQGVDVNPFLVWLGRAKTAAYPPAARDLATRAARAVADEAGVLVARSPAAGESLWRPALHRIERWWAPGPLLGIAALRHAIDVAGARDTVRDLLDLALCRTLIGTSNAAFNHQSMSFRPAADARGGHLLAAAGDTVARFAAEAAELVTEAGDGLPGSATIRRGDSRSSLRDLRPCDLLLTSPPYVNRMSYIRELRPYMYWLRFLDAPPDAGRLDWRAIGGTWGTATSKLATWTPETATPVDADLAGVRSRISADGGRSGHLLAAYVHRYVHDMWLHFQAAAGTVKCGGSVCYIVGNSCFYGHLVPIQEWYAVMLRHLGFDGVEVRVIRKRNSNKALFEYEVVGVKS
jgi:hypothetical protein